MGVAKHKTPSHFMREGGREMLIWAVLKKIKHETSRVGGWVHEALYTITLETNIVSSAAAREALREKNYQGSSENSELTSPSESAYCWISSTKKKIS